MSDVLAAVRALLDGAGIDYVVKPHEPTYTSAESARARGEPLEIGAKALVIKTDARYGLFVLPAHRKVDSAAIKRQLGVKKLRFADKDELGKLTHLVPGSVPPFGRPVLDLPLVADLGLLDNEKVAFNAGSLTTSIIMSSADYQRVSGAQWLAIAAAE